MKKNFIKNIIFFILFQANYGQETLPIDIKELLDEQKMAHTHQEKTIQNKFIKLNNENKIKYFPLLISTLKEYKASSEEDYIQNSSAIFHFLQFYIKEPLLSDLKKRPREELKEQLFSLIKLYELNPYSQNNIIMIMKYFVSEYPEFIPFFILELEKEENPKPQILELLGKVSNKNPTVTQIIIEKLKKYPDNYSYQVSGMIALISCSPQAKEAIPIVLKNIEKMDVETILLRKLSIVALSSIAPNKDEYIPLYFQILNSNESPEILKGALTAIGCYEGKNQEKIIFSLYQFTIERNILIEKLGLEIKIIETFLKIDPNNPISIKITLNKLPFANLPEIIRILEILEKTNKIPEKLEKKIIQIIQIKKQQISDIESLFKKIQNKE